MKVIHSINNYFIAEEGEAIHWSDYAWLYGSYGIILIMVIIILFS